MSSATAYIRRRVIRRAEYWAVIFAKLGMLAAFGYGFWFALDYAARTLALSVAL